jgi:signal transduction histidine kinase
MLAPPSLRTTATLSLLGFGGLVIGLNLLFLNRFDRQVIDHLERKQSIRKEGYARALRLCLIEAAAIVVGTAAMWWGWDRCITRRAGHIVEAAGHLHSTAAPAAPLPGGDEMAQISRALHQAHERLNAQASELAEKNQELENLLYVTSHDLRSPLVTIQGYGRLLDREWNLLREATVDTPDEKIRHAVSNAEAKVPRALESIEAGVARIDSLLEGLLRISRLGRSAATIETLDPRPVLDEALRALHFQIDESGAELEIGQLHACRADRMMLSQVFANLIDNAIKHRSPHRACLVRISSRKVGQRVTYEFSDNGPGIPASDQPRIFELFGRLCSEAIPGEGLGLPLVKRCLDRMHGRISLVSSENKGSTFAVELPAA